MLLYRQKIPLILGTLLLILLGSIIFGKLDHHYKRGLLNIFLAQGAGFSVVTEDVSAFIVSCCSKKADFLRLMEENNFSVKEINATNIGRQNREGMPLYNSAIYAQRGVGLPAFWRVFTLYKITAYFMDDEVVHIYAIVDTTFP
jgi:hypothetical protein